MSKVRWFLLIGSTIGLHVFMYNWMGLMPTLILFVAGLFNVALIFCVLYILDNNSKNTNK